MLPKILSILALLLLLIILVGVVISYLISAPRYVGPVSDHFDGRDFFTPGAPAPKGFREVIGWQLNHERTQPWGAFHDDQSGRESFYDAASVRRLKRPDGSDL
jgi:hypothetical protein